MNLPAELARAPQTILAVLIAPLTFLPSIVMAALRVKLLRISRLDRIGHLAIEPDCYIKDMRLGRVPFSRPIFVQRNDAPPANATLLDYWRAFVGIPPNRVAAAFLRLFYIYPYLRFRATPYAGPVRETARSYATIAAWGPRAPLLTLRPSDLVRGERELRRMGIPAGAWFVCIHAREPGYPGYTSADDDEHAYRNCVIASYRLAMEQVVARGGWCVRMGDPSGQPITPMPGVIDYAHSPFRSDWMDIFLCAQCRFFLGNTSGLFMVPTIFGVPVALAHMAPLGCVYALHSTDLSIPKHFLDASGREFSPAELMASAIGSYRHTRQYAEQGVTVLDNTPEEIRDLVVEMLDRLDGTATYDEGDSTRQKTFRALLRPGHYSYGSVAGIGRDYLRQHLVLETSAENR